MFCRAVYKSCMVVVFVILFRSRCVCVFFFCIIFRTVMWVFRFSGNFCRLNGRNNLSARQSSMALRNTRRELRVFPVEISPHRNVPSLRSRSLSISEDSRIRMDTRPSPFLPKKKYRVESSGELFTDLATFATAVVAITESSVLTMKIRSPWSSNKLKKSDNKFVFFTDFLETIVSLFAPSLPCWLLTMSSSWYLDFCYSDTDLGRSSWTSSCKRRCTEAVGHWRDACHNICTWSRFSDHKHRTGLATLG